jgi:hypothetical protein
MGVRRLGRQRPQIHERRGALHRGSIRQVQWSSFGLYMRSRRGWIGLLDQHTHVAQQQIVLEYIAVEEAPGRASSPCVSTTSTCGRQITSSPTRGVRFTPCENFNAASRY